MEKGKMIYMMRFYRTYATFFITFVLLSSCVQIDNRQSEVYMLTLTESESICFIQDADSLSYKCYAVAVDSDCINITMPYSTNYYVDDIKKKAKNLADVPIAQKQRGYRETLQELKTCIRVILSKYKGKCLSCLHCNLSDFSDIAVAVSRDLPEIKCNNMSQIEEVINTTTLATDLTAILAEYNMRVRSITLDVEAKGIYMNKDLYLSTHLVSGKNIPQKILAIPIKISIEESR